MSADTTVVIAAYRFSADSELSYTAAVVQAADNIHDPESRCAWEWAKANFLDRNHPWFHGRGAFSRAKQFANILAQEQRENGVLEYEGRPIIEIDEDRIYLLSRRGNRLPDRRHWIFDGMDEEFDTLGSLPRTITVRDMM